jgi:hypothetical protein
LAVVPARVALLTTTPADIPTLPFTVNVSLTKTLKPFVLR